MVRNYSKSYVANKDSVKRADLTPHSIVNLFPCYNKSQGQLMLYNITKQLNSWSWIHLLCGTSFATIFIIIN